MRYILTVFKFSLSLQNRRTAISTLCLRKTIHLTFDHNFGRCGPIFKILLLTDSQENSLCSYCRVFHLTLTVLLHYLVKLENYSCCRFQWRIAGETS